MARLTTKMGSLFRRKPAAAPPADVARAPTIIHPAAREADKTGKPLALPRFHTTAGDQTAGRAADRFAMIRTRLRHAFTPSQPVGDTRMFAGRVEVLKSVIRCIEDQRLHVVLYGERGIGKTSLMHMLTQAATEARYIVIYSSCGANSTFDETFRAVATDIPLLFHSGFAPNTAEAEQGSSLADLLPDGPMSPRKFGDLCAKLVGTRVLIILDEFDRCESAAFRRDIAELIKNLSDRLGRVQLVLAGVAGDLTDLVEHIPSIRRNIFALRVPKMTDEEVLQIIANGEREAGITFDPAASALVVSIAQGSPYIANLLCHHAGHAALDSGQNVVHTTDVGTALTGALAEFQGRIPKSEQAPVRRLLESGRGGDVAVAARAALACDGAFGPRELFETGGLSAAKAKDVLDRLARENLVRPLIDDDDANPRYEFIEDGLPTYLWLSWAHHNIEQKLEPAP